MGSAVVFPVRYVHAGIAIQTTSRELSAQGVFIRSLAVPDPGTRVPLALYLPNAAGPDVAIGQVAWANKGAPTDSGFWADFVVADVGARMRIANLLAARRLWPETRAFDRRRVRIGARLLSHPGRVEEQATNISRAGVFVATPEPPQVGTRVELALRLPEDTELVSSAGLVLHRLDASEGAEPGAGIQFLDATDAFRHRIDQYLDAIAA